MARIAAAALALLVLALPARAEPFLQAGTLRIEFVEAERSLAELVAEHGPATAREVGEALGVAMDFPMTISLLPEGRYRRWVPDLRGEWSAAVAWPGQGRILVNTTRVDLRNNLYQTLKHEMVHLGLGRVEWKTRNRLPLWFHEGVAQIVVGSLFRGTRDDLALAAGANAVLSLNELEESFPEHQPQVGLAYAEAVDAVEFLEKEHGPGAVRRVVAAFAEGKDFDDAMTAVTGANSATFARNWKESVDQGPPWFMVYLAQNPWMVLILLMSLAGVVLFAGYLRYRARRAAILKRWEEEEPWEE